MIRSELLYYLHDIDRFGSVTSAADNLNLTQPALSMAIKRLEKELGFQLLEREASHTRLSPEGKTLLEIGAPALDALGTISEFVIARRIRRIKAQKVAFCFEKNLTHMYLPAIAGRIHRILGEKTSVEIRIVNSAEEAIAYTHNNEYSLAVVTSITSDNICDLPNYHTIQNGAFYIRTNIHSKYLANCNTTISLGHVQDIPLIYLSGNFVDNYILPRLDTDSLDIIPVNSIQMLETFLDMDMGIAFALPLARIVNQKYRQLLVRDTPYIILSSFTSKDFDSELSDQINEALAL